MSTVPIAGRVPSPDSASQATPQRSQMHASVLMGGAALVASVSAVAIPFIAPGLLRSFGVPFNPTETKRLQTILRHLPAVNTASKGRRVVDLGSGDGRVVVAAAQAGHEAVGYEFNPWLVLYSRFLAVRTGVGPSMMPQGCALRLKRMPWSTFRGNTGAWQKLETAQPGSASGRARFVCGNMWDAPINGSSCVVIYGVEELMGRFASKLRSELSFSKEAATTVVCNTFELPGWKQHLIKQEDGVHVYSTGQNLGLEPQSKQMRTNFDDSSCCSDK